MANEPKPLKVRDFNKEEIEEIVKEVFVKDPQFKNIYKFKGSVPTENDLPTEDNQNGDVYNVLETDVNYAWTGTEWDALAGSGGGTVIKDASGVEQSEVQIGEGLEIEEGKLKVTDKRLSGDEVISTLPIGKILICGTKLITFFAPFPGATSLTMTVFDVERIRNNNGDFPVGLQYTVTSSDTINQAIAKTETISKNLILLPVPNTRNNATLKSINGEVQWVEDQA